MKRHFIELMAAMALAETINVPNKPPLPKQIAPAVPPIVPAGCKEYFFDQDGNFSTEQMKISILAFKCVASNDENAIRKFNNWKGGKP